MREKWLVYSQEKFRSLLTPANFNFIYFLATSCALQDLSSLTRDQTYAPNSGSMES